jgi:hypothetical protein
MSRFTLFCLSLAATPLLEGCDKSAGITQDPLSTVINTTAAEVADASVGARDKLSAAETKTGNAIASAETDFATTRDDYRHKMQSNIDGLERKMAILDAKAKAGTEADLRATLPALRTRRGTLLTDFHSLDHESAATWGAARARLEKEWIELKDAVEKAT